MDVAITKEGAMKKLVSILLFLLALLPAVAPLFAPGFFSMHDDTQVARVHQMHTALSQGQFPVRWVGDLGYGYGYPIFNFYGPLPYYAGALFMSLGIGALSATKLMMLVGMIALPIGVFLLLRKTTDAWTSLLCAVFAMFAPYHAVQLYVRGAVGELWAAAALPYVLLGFVYAGAKEKQAVWIGALGVAAVVTSHTLSGFVAMIGIVVYLVGLLVWSMYTRQKSWLRLRSSILLFVFGLGLSAFFWLPAFVEMRFTNVTGQIGPSADFHNHFVCMRQLWDSGWGYGGSAPGCIDGFSMKLGKLHVVFGLLGLLIWGRSRDKKKNPLVLVGAVLFVVSILLMTRASQWIWELIPGFAYIQYPWRFLSVAGLGLALMISGLSGVFHKVSSAWSIVALLLVVWFNDKLFVPQYTYQKSDQAFADTKELRFTVSKISDEYLPPGFKAPKDSSEIVADTILASPSAQVVTREEGITFGRYVIEASQSTSITIQRAAFPGWKYFLDSKEIAPRIHNGLPTISVASGEHEIAIRLGSTIVQKIGNAMSIISMVLLLLFYGRHKKTKH